MKGQLTKAGLLGSSSWNLSIRLRIVSWKVSVGGGSGTLEVTIILKWRSLMWKRLTTMTNRVKGQ